MRKAIAAIAGDFDIENCVAAVRFDRLDGESAVRERVGGLLRVDGAGEEITQPFQADFHSGGQCMRKDERP